MKSVQRWIHYCDHCKKSTRTKPSMERHEAACTMNPDRVCKSCARLAYLESDECAQRPLPELLALLPDPRSFETTTADDYGEWVTEDSDGLSAAANAALAELRKVPAAMILDGLSSRRFTTGASMRSTPRRTLRYSQVRFGVLPPSQLLIPLTVII